MSIDARVTPTSDFIRFDSPDLLAKTTRFQEWLSDWRARDLEKYLFQYVSLDGGAARVQDNRNGTVHNVQVYCSADYLDLSRDSRVIESARRAIDQFGVSVSSVPLIAGSTVIHDELERELAAFLGYEACVLFPTGQGANVSTIAALCTASDSIVIDKQVHYSVLEGVKLTGAPWRSFRHSDPDHLNVVLQGIRKRRPTNGILVIIEGVYGLDGDVAPLAEILDVAWRYGARVMLDDAHATGVLGPHGAGTAEHFGLTQLPDILMGSFSKAFGSFGGFIAAARPVVEYLRYFAKSISFSIGLPPSCAAAALQSLRLIREEPSLLSQLHTRHSLLRESLLEAGFQDVARSQSAIMSVIVGSESNVKESTRDLFNGGVWAEGLPFPATSRGQERVRFRARVSHTDEQIALTARLMQQVALKYGYLPSIRNGVLVQNYCDEKAKRLMELVYASNNHRGLPPSWFTPSYKQKQIEKSDYWTEAPFEQEWFHSGHHPYTAALCAMTFLNGGTRVGALGHFAWLPGQDSLLLDCIRDALNWLKKFGASEVYAPMQLPMQVLGAGVPNADGLPESRPFLESTNDPQLVELLDHLGFKPHHVNVYFRIELSALNFVTPVVPHYLSFRDIDRGQLQRDIDLMTPLLNETISTLPFCFPLSERFLYGIASELRDLILPGFWQLAFVDEELVGFIAAFPNVTEAVTQACGLADIADLVKVSDAMDNVEEGFVAWMGVSPRFGESEKVAEALLAHAVGAMKRRGIRSAWFSWELHNGVRQLAESDFAHQKLSSRLNYTLYRLSL